MHFYLLPLLDVTYNPSLGYPIAHAPNDPIYGMYDFEMPVGNTGIVFVASLNGILGPKGAGAIFSQRLMDAAFRRAATTLVHMGVMAAEPFSFIRQAVPLTLAEAAALLDTTAQTISDYETGVLPLTRDAWITIAEAATQKDDRAMTPYLALTPVDLRPRRIRIVIDYTS